MLQYVTKQLFINVELKILVTITPETKTVVALPLLYASFRTTRCHCSGFRRAWGRSVRRCRSIMAVLVDLHPSPWQTCKFVCEHIIASRAGKERTVLKLSRRLAI